MLFKMQHCAAVRKVQAAVGMQTISNEFQTFSSLGKVIANIPKCPDLQKYQGASPNHRFFRMHKGPDGSSPVHKTIHCIQAKRNGYFSKPSHLIETACCTQPYME